MKNKLYCILIRLLVFVACTTSGLASFAQNYADGTGQGSMQGAIFWLNWDSGNSKLLGPSGFNSTGVIENGEYIWQFSDHVRIKAQLSNVSVTPGSADPMIGYDPGEWTADRLNELYPGVSDIGILVKNATGEFDISITLELLTSGSSTWVSYPYPGIVVADAESMSNSNGGDYIEATANDVEGWRLLDYRYRHEGGAGGTTDETQYKLVLSNSGKTFQIKMDNGDGEVAAVMYAHHATGLTDVKLKGGGNTAIAIGFVAPFDLGDAPPTYGFASSYIDEFELMGTVEEDDEYTLANLTPTSLTPVPKVFIGEDNVDADGEAFGANGAVADNNSGNNDEATFDPEDLPVIKVNQDEAYEITIPVTNGKGIAATLYGWIDFNADGYFSPEELVTKPVGVGANNADITLSFPSTMFNGIAKAGEDLYARFRITTTDLSDDPETEQDERSFGVSADGETEDYQLKTIEGVTISGTVFHDLNGLSDNVIDGEGIGEIASDDLYAYLVDATGIIVDKTAVGIDGTYELGADEVGGYTVVISTDSSFDIGGDDDGLEPNLPAGWIAAGDAYGVNNGAAPVGESFEETADLRMPIVIPGESLDISGVNFAVKQKQKPIAEDDVETIDQGQTATIPVLDNDEAPDGSIDATTVQLIDPDSGDPTATVEIDDEGTYTVNATTGVVTFEPLPGFAGNATVQYTVEDNGGEVSDPATITITVKPIGANDTDATLINAEVSTDVRANDGPLDEGGDPIGSSFAFGTISEPSNGTAEADPENPGQILYSPDEDFIGKDSYTYTLVAGGVESDPITVTINVKPAGVDDDDTVDANSSTITAVKDNDGLPSGIDVNVDIDEEPTNGTAVVNPDGTVTYTPDEDFYGTDTYTYTLTVETADGDVVSDPITVTIIVVAAPELTVTKAIISTGPYDSTDDVITYDIVVTNTGNVTIDHIVLMDANAVIPVGEENIGTLAPGDYVTVTVTHAITQTDLNNGSVSNQATAAGDDPNGDSVTDASDDPGTPGVPNDPTDTDVVQVSSLTFTKEVELTTEGDVDKNEEVSVDDVLTYTFTVTNTGNVTLSDVSVTEDTFSGTGSLTLSSPAASSGSSASALLPGGTLTYTATYTVRQSDVDAGLISNQAIVSVETPTSAPDISDTPSDNPGTPADLGDATDIAIPQVADLAFVKEVELTTEGDVDENEEVSVDDILTYTFTVTNTGNVTLSDVGITDTDLPGLGTLDYTWPQPSSPGVLAPSESVTAIATYTVTQADVETGLISNQALVSAVTPPSVDDDIEDVPSGNDPSEPGTPAELGDATEITVPQHPVIELVKTFVLDREVTGGAGRVDAGDQVTYTFKVTNRGNITLTGVRLSEIDFSGTGNYRLPDDAVFVSATEGNAAGRLIPGETATYTLTYTLTQEDIDAGELVNSTLVTGTPPSGPSGNVTDISDTATDANGDEIPDASDVDTDGMGAPGDDPSVTLLPATPSIELVKTFVLDREASGEDGRVDAGDQVTYTFEVTNTGNVTLRGVELTEIAFSGTGHYELPNDALFVSSSEGSTVGTLLPGETATYTLIYTLTPEDLDAGKLVNSSRATGTPPSGPAVTDVSDTATDADGGNITDPANIDNDTDGDKGNDPTIINLPQMPTLQVTKKITSTGPYNTVDDVITYNIIVTNIGNVIVQHIVLVDDNATIPTGKELIGALAPGESKAVEVTHIITQEDLNSGSVSNQATATGKDPNGDLVTDDSDNPDTPDDPNDPTRIDMLQLAELTITKSAKAGEYASSGDVITYDITVMNSGNVSLTNIAITDANADAGSITPATIAALEPGESRTAMAAHTLTQADIDAGYVYNIAQATGEAPNGDEVSDESHDPNPLDPDAPQAGDCADCTVTPIEIKPAVALVAVATNSGSGRNGSFLVGDEIEYRFTVVNRGNSTLNGFVLNDVKLGLKDVAVDETLAPGESFVRTFRYTITPEDLVAKQVVTTATVDAQSLMGKATTDVSGDDVTNDVPTIVPVAEGPESVADEGSTPQNTPVTIEVVSNDEEGSSDIDPHTVRLIDPETGKPSESVTIPEEGTYTVGSDGAVTFTPVREFYGESTVQYVVRDVNGLETDPAAITVIVTQSKPTASDDTQQGSFNGPVQIQLLNNDQPDTAPLDPSTIEIVGQPQHGTLQIGTDGVVTYSPNQYYIGPDEFSYRVRDVNGNWTNVATVRITVSGFKIPNIITPNGDGQNDRFVIVGLADYDNADVVIFNRWGNEVYRSRSYKQDWDAQGVSEGTYYYLITLRKDGKETVHKGWLVIKRK